MGKKAKEHRKKVEKRNKIISQKKSGMQKAFDLLMKQQIENIKNDKIDVSLGDKPLNFSIVDEKEIESSRNIKGDSIEIKKENSEEEE